ncbi:hypothetical protein [Runella sp. SP2]|uniref:hypothetical protein n=1 Tax=Runella sp. SP2 TaxID=2268026 RepID=UPI0013DDAED3|nr:hypothetical protein [Runella sp. SP2]
MPTLSQSKAQQSAKISIERTTLEALAAKVQKADIYERQNTNLLKQSAELKEEIVSLKVENKRQSDELLKHQKKWRYAIMAIVVLVFLVIVLLRR